EKLGEGVVAATRREADEDADGLALEERCLRHGRRRCGERHHEHQCAGGVCHAVPQTSCATSTIRESLRCCISGVTPMCSLALVENPHCGDRASWSSSMKRFASSIRRLSSSTLSSSFTLEATRPSTTVLPFGTTASGSKPPARALSYSRK